jgi:N-methylhydantoinase A
MSVKMSIDVGGTFTDVVVADERGLLDVYKSPTTPLRFSDGVIASIEVAAKDRGKSVTDLLRECSALVGGSLIHGSTITTNAVLEGKVAKVGLIVTRGHRDILVIRSGGERHNPYNWKQDYAPPYVPRYLTMEVTERINAEGEIVVPLDEEDVRRAVTQLKSYNVDVIAVCLIWDILNPAHEHRIREIIKEEWPEIPCVLAVDLNPCLREVWRASSACIDASLIPIVGNYYSDLDTSLRERGYAGDISMLTSTGGIFTVEESLAKPIYSIDCGPAMAPVAGRMFGKLERDIDNVLTMDMGGTSFDVSSVVSGTITVTRQAKVNNFYDLGIAKVDSRSIGAGGGSIAWLGPGGLIRTGPQSAGSSPGPACYGKGGEEPTVTDANVVLGLLDPENYLGGRMKLYPELSEKAIIHRIAGPLNMPLKEAAFAIWTSVNTSMIAAIEELTIWQGIDPREHLFVIGGGAAGLHAVPICRELGAKEALLPRVAAGLSAVGGLFANVVGEYSVGYFTESYRFNYDEVNYRLQELEQKGIAFLERARIPENMRRLEFYCEARYPYQIWELPVLLRVTRFTSEEEVLRLVEDFHEVHERVFAHKENTFIEIIHFRIRAIGETDKPQIRDFPLVSDDPSQALRSKRNIYLGPQVGEVEAQVYSGPDLQPGNVVRAPSIIEEPTTTLAILPGSSIVVTKYRNYIISISGTEEGE